METYSSRREINDFADEIIDYFKIGIPIKDMEQVINLIGGKIEYSLSKFADSQIKRVGNGFSITVPKEKTNETKFSIACELGHLFLHMGYMVEQSLWEENKDNCYLHKFSGEMEYQAYEFALSLLMPRKQFITKMEECYLGDGEYNIKCMAKYFEVSKSNVLNRTKRLGIL